MPSLATRSFFAAVALAAALPAAAQPDDELAGRRSDVLSVLGDAESEDIDIVPMLGGPGVIFTQRLDYEAARSLRVHFRVVRQDTDPSSWRLELVRRRNNVVWAREGAGVADGEEFWSDEVETNQVMVRVIGARAANDFELHVDQVAVWKEPTIPESITDGIDGMVPLDHQDPWVLESATGVARLQLVGSDRKVYACTGFLLTHDLLLTNQHCISSDAELKSALVDFDYDRPKSKVLRVTLRELVASSVKLDYALVRLSQAVDRKTLVLDARPVAGPEDLLVIQHPGGKPKRISRMDCFVVNTTAAGRTREPTDFTHHCDTLGSSSGSPVFSLDRQTVVGLHHLGFEQNDQVLQNRAVQATQLIADLCAHVPDFTSTGNACPTP